MNDNKMEKGAAKKGRREQGKEGVRGRAGRVAWEDYRTEEKTGAIRREEETRRESWKFEAQNSKLRAFVHEVSSYSIRPAVVNVSRLQCAVLYL